MFKDKGRTKNAWIVFGVKRIFGIKVLLKKNVAGYSVVMFALDTLGRKVVGTHDTQGVALG